MKLYYSYRRGGKDEFFTDVREEREEEESQTLVQENLQPMRSNKHITEAYHGTLLDGKQVT